MDLNNLSLLFILEGVFKDEKDFQFIFIAQPIVFQLIINFILKICFAQN